MMHRQHYTPESATRRGQALADVAAAIVIALALTVGALAYFDVLTK